MFYCVATLYISAFHIVLHKISMGFILHKTVFQNTKAQAKYRQCLKKKGNGKYSLLQLYAIIITAGGPA